MKSFETAVGVACQIAYEYPDWGEEHVSDMLATYRDSGEPEPCTGDELYELTIKAERLKKQGKAYNEAEKELLEGK